MCEARRAHLTGMQASAQSRRPGNAWGLVSVALRSDASQGAARLLRCAPALRVTPSSLRAQAKPWKRNKKFRFRSETQALKSETFYVAKKRNFLLCLDTRGYRAVIQQLAKS
jgi:hypothetical protein